MAAPRRRMVTKWIVPLVDPRQLGVVDHLAVEVEPLGVGAGDLVPELDEPHQFAVLIGAGQVGVGVAQAAAVLLQGEEGQDARPGLAPQREVMAVERRGVAAEGDRMEVEREPLGLGEQHRGQGLDPALQQAPLLVATGAVGVVGGERLLGQDVEAGEQAEGLVAVEVVDMTASFLVEQLQRQQREQGAGGGDHLRAGIPGLGDESIEAEPGQEGQEEEDARDARAERAAGRRGSARDSRRLRASRGRLALGRRRRRGAARGRRGEKGGRDAAATIGPQAAGHRLQRRGLVAEPLGDAIEGLVIDEDRAEGLVLALEGLLWARGRTAWRGSRP